MAKKINRSLGWKIGNLWSLVFLPTIFFSPIALLIMGVRSDNKVWTYQSIAMLFIMWICGFVGAEIKFFIWIFIFIWLFLIVYTLIKSKEFLQLLDAEQRSEDFSHSTTSPENNSSQSKLPQLSLGEQFIADLQKWKREIKTPRMQDHIQDLIDLSNVVMQKKSEENPRFFMRYSETINNLLQKYDEIENTKLNTLEIKGAMVNVENNFGKIIGAFRNEVTSIYQNDILNINAETAAFMQDLKNRGLIDDNVN